MEHQRIHTFTCFSAPLCLSTSFSGFTKHIIETRCPLLIFSLCVLFSSHTSTSAHQPINAVCPKHFQTHNCVCGDIRCICHASYIFKWNYSICHQKRFCSECSDIILHTLCRTLPFPPLLYRIWMYASVNISNSSVLHLHHV